MSSPWNVVVRGIELVLDPDLEAIEFQVHVLGYLMAGDVETARLPDDEVR